MVACIVHAVYLSALRDGDVWMAAQELAAQGVQGEAMGTLVA